MNLQLAMEKSRLVRWLKDALRHEWWGRKVATAEEIAEGCPVTARDIEAAAPHDGGALDVHPLFLFRPLQAVVDSDRLYWQAAMDLATHNGYPDSEIAKAKILAAAQMQRDAKVRAVTALRRWADELERVA